MSLPIDNARAEFEFEFPNEQELGLESLLKHVQKIINVKDAFHETYKMFIDSENNETPPDSPHTNKQLMKDNDDKLRFYFPLKFGTENTYTVEELHKELRRFKNEQEKSQELTFDLLIGLPVTNS